jgi:hypothetical protein
MPHSVSSFTSQSSPTLEEVRSARPPRGNGAPSRTRSHYERILALLRERGPAGVLSSELYDAPHLFGRSPRNRISEMRQDGHLIKTIQAGPSVVRYVLTHENPSPTERPHSSSSDWYERQTGKPRPVEQRQNNDLPLFAVTRP